MNNYREDTMETAVATDTIWIGVHSIAEERAKASDMIQFRLGFLTGEVATAYDFSDPNVTVLTTETVKASTITSNQLYAIHNLIDQAKLTDSIKLFFHVDTAENAIVHDEVKLSQRFVSVETAQASDLIFVKKTVHSNTAEVAKALDHIYALHAIETIEIANIADQPFHQLKTKITALESAMVTDSPQVISRINLRCVESVKTSVDVTHQLYAKSWINELAFADDYYLSAQHRAQAWTANTNTWAMSRYEPFNFRAMAVINDQLYLLSDDGVYLSGLEGESIQAKVKTGKLDFGEMLIHPLSHFLEYQLKGINRSLHVTIGTTQSGNAQFFNYSLPLEHSDHLTNGRVQFGRGLRGRHFSFEIQMQGSSVSLNSQSIDYTETRRRI